MLLTCDELAPGYYNFNNAPGHVVGLRTDSTKLGTYANGVPLTDRMRQSIGAEFYDYATPGARAELDNLVHDERSARVEDAIGPDYRRGVAGWSNYAPV